ncbi:MAG: flavodoxin family protein [Parasporobacterium sp.]|nr:flavodoxin family protein [Parasporobacterium sp.]
MKVLGISAGRKNGNSDIAVKEALLGAQEKGAEVIFINLWDYNILPCSGCESCTMMMGDVMLGKRDNYPGCVLKNKDDMDKIMQVFQTCNGLIVGCPTYDLMPSSLYTRFAQRFLAYELAFMLKIGAVKENPNMVAGLIAVGGSCHDWQGLSLETLAATMFTTSVRCVDQYMVTRVGRPGNVVIRPDHIERCHKMGENIVECIKTPVEERHWMGDPDQGLCPNCHGGLVFKGEEHWDGIKFPYECVVCGAGLKLIDGKFQIVTEAEDGMDGLCRDRNVDEARGYHLDEIVSTRIHFFQTLEQDPSVKETINKYKEIKFQGI